MITDQLRRLISASPFRRFAYCMTDGHEIEVKHPEFVMISPGGSTAISYVSDEAAEIIPMVQVTRIRTESQTSTPGRSS